MSEDLEQASQMLSLVKNFKHRMNEHQSAMSL